MVLKVKDSRTCLFTGETKNAEPIVVNVNYKWIYFDGIDEVAVSHEENPIYHVEEIKEDRLKGYCNQMTGEYILICIGNEDPLKARLVIACNEAYLLSDDGKTIERL